MKRRPSDWALLVLIAAYCAGLIVVGVTFRIFKGS